MATSRPKKTNPKNRKTKTFLEFDEKARSEYLRGFHKRKIDRKKLAREKQDKKILAERKEILKQARDLKSSHLKQNSSIIPEISTLVDPETYELPEHTVTIADIGEIDFVGKGGFHLGQNKGFSPESNADETTHTPVTGSKESKSIQHKLAACSNQLSSAKLNAKRMKKKHMLRMKFQAKKKGEKKGKKKKK
uniref:Nucleolar protein 12 n=1 Tax=Biomphalaria glabrata TaxID=6526 RepID=A0A2C9LFG5_BIOGL